VPTRPRQRVVALGCTLVELLPRLRKLTLKIGYELPTIGGRTVTRASASFAALRRTTLPA
jgi:hypothetical protein